MGDIGTKNADFSEVYEQWRKDNSPLFKEAISSLEANGKSSDAITSLLEYVKSMESAISKMSESHTEMKLQLAEMKEIQNHPVKNILNKIHESIPL